ncbi:MAG TPA: hypothetical protein VHW66_14060 [Stellaceae bacterium]|nr:hypothetical protein [Stellaceae bacterium]
MSLIVETPPGEIVWDAGEAAPALVAQVPGLAGHLAALRRAVPVAQELRPFEAEGCVRPHRHLRAFYRAIPEGIIAVKGSEPLAPHVEPHFAVMSRFRIDYPARGKSLFSALEHFPLIEQKIPLAVALDEAREDARAAEAVQSAHLARFGGLARVPLPLLVLRWPDAAVERHVAAMAPLLSGRARRIVETQAAGGFGAFVYYYPSVPLRVAHLPAILGLTGGEPEWRTRLAAIADPAVAIERWIDLVARMLALGFLPGSIESIGVGHCLEMKNAVIDGGFVDLGSVQRMEAVTTPQGFAEPMLAAVADLAKTIRHLLRGNAVDVEAEYRNPSLAMLMVLHRLLPALGERVRAHGSGDPRVAAFFTPTPAAEGLIDGLAALHSDEIAAGGHA